MSLARGSTHKLPHMTTKASAYPCSGIPAYSRVVGDRLSLIANIFRDTDGNKVLNIYSNKSLSLKDGFFESNLLFERRAVSALPNSTIRNLKPINDVVNPGNFRSKSDQGFLTQLPPCKSQFCDRVQLEDFHSKEFLK